MGWALNGLKGFLLSILDGFDWIIVKLAFISVDWLPWTFDWLDWDLKFELTAEEKIWTIAVFTFIISPFFYVFTR